MSTKPPKAAKTTATSSGTEGKARLSSAEAVVVAALRSKASELACNTDSTQKEAARIVEWAASADGKALRGWLFAFAARQADAPTWEKFSERVPFKRGWSQQRYGVELDRLEDQWKAEVVSDGQGNPAQIDVVEYIDRLAYWAASTKPPTPWMRIGAVARRKHLAGVQKKAAELAKLLEWSDGPEWPKAIALFEAAHRPIMGGAMPWEEYRTMVAHRLKGQTIPQLLRSLAERTRRQERVDQLEAAKVSRPNAGAVRDRMQAEQMQWWFETYCRLASGDELHLFIADLMNAGRSESLLKEQGIIDAEMVKEWLRERNR